MLARSLALLLVAGGALVAQDAPFALSAYVPLGPTPRLLSAGDLDGDDDADIVATLADGSLSVVLSLGTAGFTPPAAVPSLTGTNRTALADVDLDGDLDLLACIDGPTYEYLSLRRGLGDGSFAATASFHVVNGSPVDLEVGDVDADGAPDVAVACKLSARISLLLGHGDGGFDPAYDVPVSANVVGLALGQLDAAAPLDMAAVTSAGLLVPLVGDGLGGFTKGPVQGVTTSVRDVDLGDVDGDGDDDAVTCSNVAQGLLALAVGDGTFALPVAHVLDEAASRAVIVDVDEDGLADVVHDSEGVEYLRSLGGGALAPSQRFGGNHLSPDVVVADVTGDGDLDLFVIDNNLFVFGHGVLQVGDGTGGFGPRLLTGAGAWEVAAGDLDEDGWLDLVTAADDENTVQVHRGRAHGCFTGGGTVYPGGGATGGVAVADFHGDGWLDVLVASTGGITLLRGLGPGGLGPPHHKDLSAFVRDIAVADYDGDSELDVAAVAAPQSLFILLGDGEGAFTLVQTIPLGGPGLSLVAADLNGDLRPDLLSRRVAGQVDVVLSLPGGGFAAPVVISTPVGSLLSVCTGDVDGDDDADVLASAGISPSGYLFLNDGSGGLTAAGGALDIGAATQVQLADVTLDGVLDIVGGTYSAVSLPMSLGGLVVCAGQGDGTFGAPVTDLVEAQAASLLVQDLDGDAAPDVVLTTGSDALTVRLNTLGPWDDLGFPLAGELGLPRMFSQGSLKPGTWFTLELADARPNGAAALVAGVSAVFAPFKGGTLVPFPAFLSMVPVNAEGQFYSGAIDTPVAPGAEIWLQFWIPDPAGVKGFAASNALRATLP